MPAAVVPRVETNGQTLTDAFFDGLGEVGSSGGCGCGNEIEAEAIGGSKTVVTTGRAEQGCYKRRLKRGHFLTPVEVVDVSDTEASRGIRQLEETAVYGRAAKNRHTCRNT